MKCCFRRHRTAVRILAGGMSSVRCWCDAVQLYADVDMRKILSYRLAPAQFADTISLMSTTDSYGLMEKLLFYLSQSTMERDYKLLLNLYILIKKIFQINRDVLLSQLMANCNVSDVTTYLIYLFSGKQMSYQPYY